MQFHPSKCQVVCVTNKRKPIQATYNIHGMTLEEVPSAKYLGLHVDKKLSFNTHVNITCKKANSTRALLQRNFSHCSRKIKEAKCKTYVRPIAEYAAVAWDSNTQRNIRKIEQIQRSSARYVTNTYDRRSSITALLSELQWPSLQERRRQSRLAMLFRIRFNLVDINWKDHLSESTSATRGHTHSCRFMNPHCSSQARRKRCGMAAVAAPKICRERERKGREGTKEREKRRKKRERRKGKKWRREQERKM